MRVVVQNSLNNRRWEAYEGDSGFTIGRGESCQVRLDSRFVSLAHALIERSSSGWEIHLPNGVNAIELEGRVLEAGQSACLPEVCRLQIIEFELILDSSAGVDEHDIAAEAQINELVNLIHTNVLYRLDLRIDAQSTFAPTQARTQQIDGAVDELIYGEFKEQIFSPVVSYAVLRQTFAARLSNMLAKQRTDSNAAKDETPHSPSSNQIAEEAAAAIDARLAQAIGLDDESLSFEEAELLIERKLADHLPQSLTHATESDLTYLIANRFKKLLYDIIFGYGPLQDLLNSPTVSEIMVVSPQLIYCEQHGNLSRCRRRFPSEAAAISVIERIVAPIGRRIDRSQPLVDARLPDGSRVNAVIPPLAVKGPCITIRKFPTKQVTIEQLKKWRSISNSAAALLDACVKNRANIVVAGGTGSGKTTLLNALSSMIPEHERVVTIEDSAELQLQQAHVVTLESRPPNAEGTGAYTIRDLVKNALRMRPDRIIVGECRGGEALDMLQAMNTGHDGSMTTLHANSAMDVVSRIETMVLMAAQLPINAVRKQIINAVDLIVFTERLTGGRRMVTQIAEVTGIDPQTQEVRVLDILAARGRGQAARLMPTGYMPSFVGGMIDQGFLDLERWFEEGGT